MEGMQFGDNEGGLPYTADVKRLVPVGPVNMRLGVAYRRVRCTISATRESVESREMFEFAPWTITMRLRPGQFIQEGDTIENIVSTRTGRRSRWEPMNVVFVEMLDPYTYQALCKEAT